MSDETPYAVVTRMQAEGHPKKAIVERLKAMGLDDGDISVLTFKDLPSPPADDTADEKLLLRVGVSLVAGPLVGALVGAALTDAPPPAAPLGPQQALDPMDTAARCAWHPMLASVTGCPRCGSFTCRDCAPKEDEAICQSCRVSPANRDLRIRKATRWISLIRDRSECRK